GAVAALGGGKLQGEDVTLRAGVLQGPGDPGILGRVDDAFLARDPCRVGVETAHGQERSLGVRVLLLPGGTAVARPEDAPELPHHPAVLIAGKAGREEVLVNLPQVDGRRPRGRRASQGERDDDELHADPPRCSGMARAELRLYRTVSSGLYRPLGESVNAGSRHMTRTGNAGPQPVRTRTRTGSGRCPCHARCRTAGRPPI